MLAVRWVFVLAIAVLFPSGGIGQTSRAACSNLSFGAPLTLSNAGPPIAVGDFNNDGNLDIATALRGFSILLGDGKGRFGAPVSLAPGAYYTHMAVADLNGDGIADLALTATESNRDRVQLCVSNGTGNLCAGRGSGFRTGATPYAVAAGDFNGDGRTDLVTVNVNSSTLSVSLGDGNGNFSNPRTIAVAKSPQFVAVADFDGDGKLDLAVTTALSTSSGNTSNILILQGDGTGGFTERLRISVPFYAQHIVTADFNRDGKPDIAVSLWNQAQVAVFLGNGDGTFQAAKTFSVGTNPASIAVADFNSDGFLDLAVANHGSNTVTVLLGDGTGDFGRSQTLGANRAPHSIAVGDFDRDGYPDLAVGNMNSNDTSVFLNTCGKR